MALKTEKRSHKTRNTGESLEDEKYKQRLSPLAVRKTCIPDNTLI